MNSDNPKILKSELEPIDSHVLDPKFREELERDIYDPNSKLNKDKKEKYRFGFNSIENVKFKHPIQYDRKQYDEFKHRLAIAICNNGISCKEAAQNPQYADYIANYVEVNFLKKDNMFKILGITLRFDNVVLGGLTIDNKKISVEFPVIMEFHGHFLKQCRYFKKNDADNGVEECIIPVVNSKIVVY